MIMEKEIWKDVVGREGEYQVSSFGRVKSLNRTYKYFKKGKWWNRKLKGRILSIKTIGSSGYYDVALGAKGKKMVHRLVAEAFLGPEPKGRRCVNHKDFNRLNNRADNLEWMSHKENYDYSNNAGRYVEHRKRKSEEMKLKLSKGCPWAILKEWQVVKIKELISQGVNDLVIGEKYGVHKTTIADIRRGLTWKRIPNPCKE